METVSVCGGSEGSGDSEEEELEVSGGDGPRWAGLARLGKMDDESHGTPSAEDTQVESDRTCSLSAEDAQEELNESKKGPFTGENRRFAKRTKTPLITSSSKVAKQPASPKVPQLASSNKVEKQPASPKLLAAHLSHPKADVASSQSGKTNRTGRPKGILETRPRPSFEET